TSPIQAVLPLFHDPPQGTAPPTKSPRPGPPHQSGSSRQSVLSTPHTDHPAPAACHWSAALSWQPNSAAADSNRATRPLASAPRCTPYTPHTPVAAAPSSTGPNQPLPHEASIDIASRSPLFSIHRSRASYSDFFRCPHYNDAPHSRIWTSQKSFSSIPSILRDPPYCELGALCNS